MFLFLYFSCKKKKGKEIFLYNDDNLKFSENEISYLCNIFTIYPISWKYLLKNYCGMFNILDLFKFQIFYAIL